MMYFLSKTNNVSGHGRKSLSRLSNLDAPLFVSIHRWNELYDSLISRKIANYSNNNFQFSNNYLLVIDI